MKSSIPELFSYYWYIDGTLLSDSQAPQEASTSEASIDNEEA